MAVDSGLSSVTTFVAELPGLPVEEVLRTKFTGWYTPRSYAAACRISAKRRIVKVPAHLMRQLWRITGGWGDGRLISGWGSSGEPQVGWWAVEIGDLRVYLNSHQTNYCSLQYRGHKVGSFSMINASPWVSREAALAAFKALGRPYQPQPVT